MQTLNYYLKPTIDRASTLLRNLIKEPIMVDFYKGPSKHLTWKELACKDGTPYPTQWMRTRALDLALVFEQIRTACGDKPIIVNSAYRTPEYNAKLEGSSLNSQHIQGRALDLRPPKGMSVLKFGQIIRKIADDMYYDPTLPDLIGGIGYYKTFIHVDTRPGKRLAVWWG